MEKRFNFTKAAIDALPNPEKRTRYYDVGGRSSVRGLCLIQWPTGGKVFYLYRKVDGRPVDVKLGAYPDMTIDQARAKVEQLNGAIANQDDPVKLARKKKGEMTFGELFKWYMEAHSKPRKKTWRQDERRFDCYLQALAGQRISRISRADLRQLHAELGKEHPATANKVLLMIQSIFTQAIYHEVFDGANPAIGIRKFKEQSRERRLTAEEMKRLLAAVEEDPSDYLGDFVKLALYTGQRCGNLLAMRWDQVDLAEGLWVIPMTKNGRPHLVPLEAQEIAILKSRQGNRSPWVFPGRGASGHIEEPKKAWSTLLTRAKIDEFRIHDLRRTHGSWMLNTGSSLEVIGKSLAHQDSDTTAIYARLDLAKLREAKARAIDAMLIAAAKIEKPI
jgi:integrase